MSQTFSVNIFEWTEDISQFNGDIIKTYNKESGEGHFLEVDIQYFEKFHNDLPFLLERKKIEKVEKLAVGLHNKTEYVVHKRNLKQALNNRLVF